MGQDKSKWSVIADKELRDKSAEDLTWKTLEGIEVSPLYTQEDLNNLKHLGTLPGQEPFTRGVKATMYAGALGLLGNMQDFLRLRNQTNFIEKLWRLGSRVSRWLLILLLTEATIVTTPEFWVTLARLVLR